MLTLRFKNFLFITNTQNLVHQEQHFLFFIRMFINKQQIFCSLDTFLTQKEKEVLKVVAMTF